MENTYENMNNSGQEQSKADTCPQCGCIIEKGTYHYCDSLYTNITAIFNNFEYF